MDCAINQRVNMNIPLNVRRPVAVVSLGGKTTVVSIDWSIGNKLNDWKN